MQDNRPGYNQPDYTHQNLNQPNYNQPNYNEKPQNFMTLSIISTILGCCSFWGLGFISGIVAIYFASQVNNKFYSGDTYGAEKSSKNARIAAFIALGFFAIGLISSAVIYLFYPEMLQENMEMWEEMMEQWESAQ